MFTATNLKKYTKARASEFGSQAPWKKLGLSAHAFNPFTGFQTLAESKNTGFSKIPVPQKVWWNYVEKHTQCQPLTSMHACICMYLYIHTYMHSTPPHTTTTPHQSSCAKVCHHLQYYKGHQTPVRWSLISCQFAVSMKPRSCWMCPSHTGKL